MVCLTGSGERIFVEYSTHTLFTREYVENRGFSNNYDLGLTQFITVAVIIGSGGNFVITGSDEKLSVLLSLLTMQHYMRIATLPHEMFRRSREESSCRLITTL
jgi:hypothetical protein